MVGRLIRLSGDWSGEGGPQPGGVDAPVVVLATVDEGDRDLVAEAAFEVGRARDGDLGVRVPQLGADRAVVVVDVEVRDQRLDALAGGLSRRRETSSTLPWNRSTAA